MENNENKVMKQELNDGYGLIVGAGEISVSKIEYGILLRKAQRYDMLIAALLDSTRLDYGNELQVDDAEKILRIFEKEKYIAREKQLLEERATKRREAGE